MPDSEKKETAKAALGERPSWEENHSREIEDLARQAEAFQAEWKTRYADDLFENPLALEAYHSMVKAHLVLRVFKVIYSRKEAGKTSLLATFEEEFERTILAAIGSEEAPR